MAQERVFLARGHDVLISVQHTADWTIDFPRSARDDSAQLNKSCLFTTKTTTEALDFTTHLVGCYAGNLRDVRLRLSRILRARMNFNLSIPRLWNNNTRILLEI